ncbi:hypothetical protein [Absidia glauca]|uniref:Signal recognition particle receptor subunit beta n=1 Tax=Absidia glauca TaxID=4829 RepID=A0A163MGU2_ABSGL|nr:hypothetical protein [Absidia glauca]
MEYIMTVPEALTFDEWAVLWTKVPVCIYDKAPRFHWCIYYTRTEGTANQDGDLTFQIPTDSVILSAVGKQQKKNTVLLLGITDAGKTSLFTLIRYGKVTSTVTSMKENEGPCTFDNKTYELVDIPGHERVRYRYTDFLPISRCILFVVDSTTINRQVRPVAEYLYHLLAHASIQSQKTPILIVCNKSDMITALPPSRIQSLLESEINRLRATRTAAVEKQDSDADEQEAFLGYEGEDFKFDHLDNKVDFEQCCVLRNEVDSVTSWAFSV